MTAKGTNGEDGAPMSAPGFRARMLAREIDETLDDQVGERGCFVMVHPDDVALILSLPLRETEARSELSLDAAWPTFLKYRGSRFLSVGSELGYLLFIEANATGDAPAIARLSLRR